jgi:pimeloyl-ACP methyl ester carboxylesterase
MIAALDYGGPGQTLLFLHANGYPPGCYLPLFNSLADRYHITAVLQRPLWSGSRPEEIGSWIPLSADLLQFLDQNDSQTDLARGSALRLVVGHSLGGIVALRAAIHRPQEFAALVLIEPVLFPPQRILAWRWLRLWKRTDRLPLIDASRRRRRSFDDLDRLFKGYRQRRAFRFMDDAALWAYIKAMTCPDGDGVYHLCYSAEWETRIYETGVWPDLDLWWALPRLKIPTLILRGAETDTFWESTGRLVQRANRAITVATIAHASHLLPMERPREVADRIREFFSAVPFAAAGRLDSQIDRMNP